MSSGLGPNPRPIVPESDGVAEGDVGPSRSLNEGIKRGKNDRMTWVPKFEGDSMRAHTNGVPEMNPFTQEPDKFVVGDGKPYYIITDNAGRTMKVRPMPNGYEVVWQRWSV